MADDTLIIAGSGRSGTTWILDVIAESNNLRPVFEPLYSVGVKEARDFSNRYIKETAYEPELKHLMSKVFNGELNHLWPNTRFLKHQLRPVFSQLASWGYTYIILSRYKVFLIQYFTYLKKNMNRPIIKFIRANLMLDWLIANFNIRLIFLVRHPGAVAASKISAARRNPRAAWDFIGLYQQSILSKYKNDKELKDDYLCDYFEIFSEKLTPVAGHTLLWCIENILPIYRLQKKNIKVFFYEDVVVNPEREFDHMVKLLGLNRIPSFAIIKKPSQQASREMRKKEFDKNQLTRWSNNFSNQQLDEIDRILKFFNVTTYSAYEPMPIKRTQDFI